ncbi:hypothetical protein E2C01_012756 [Portunus trituberculatus]|uniref:Uncharacterized protein n=1 Tax=Portunus trituberculatus TaxID=210409 RepID=A0A5B7DFH3_PORTR|nr:hypothetical protein [Portunus trituberculatus]
MSGEGREQRGELEATGKGCWTTARHLCAPEEGEQGAAEYKGSCRRRVTSQSRQCLRKCPRGVLSRRNRCP